MITLDSPSASYHLIDTTLRDGEQAPGVVFTLEEKMAVCRLLDELGITEVELGMPGMGLSELEEMRVMTNEGFRFQTLSWCRALPQDIKYAAAAETDAVHLSLPVSDIQLKTLGKNRNWVLKQLSEMVKLAKDYFPQVSVGALDGTRADDEFLTEYLQAAQEAGAFRVRIADTVGVSHPLQVFLLFQKLRQAVDGIHLEFHGHNDLGMAVANTVSAFQGGADSASVTVNGLGERAGNAALEEVIMSFRHSLKLSENYETRLLDKLCRLVEEYSGRVMSVSKPVTGEMVLCHESGIHTRSLMKDRKSYQIFSAEEIGKKEKSFVFGKHSGSAALKRFFHQKGIFPDDHKLNLILLQIKQLGTAYKRAISSLEIEELYRNMELKNQSEKIEMNAF